MEGYQGCSQKGAVEAIFPMSVEDFSGDFDPL